MVLFLSWSSRGNWKTFLQFKLLGNLGYCSSLFSFFLLFLDTLQHIKPFWFNDTFQGLAAFLDSAANLATLDGRKVGNIYHFQLFFLQTLEDNTWQKVQSFRVSLKPIKSFFHPLERHSDSALLLENSALMKILLEPSVRGQFLFNGHNVW